MVASLSDEHAHWTPPHAIRRVAVLGAGAAGMPMARHLNAAGIEVKIFERNPEVGGIWRYVDDKRPVPLMPSTSRTKADYQPDLLPVTVDLPHTEEEVFVNEPAAASSRAQAMLLELAPPGPAYDSLKNNIPGPLMVFQDCPRRKGEPWYITHEEHQLYLMRYSESFGISDMTSFNTRVEKVDEIVDDHGHPAGWSVWTKKIEIVEKGARVAVQTTYDVETFDAVVCATGHHNAPATPDIPGLSEWQQTWPDRVSHAINFRRGEDFRGRRNVLIVGSGPSGSDMAREIEVYADHVYVTTRPFETDDSPDTMIVKTVFRDRLVSDKCSLVPVVKRFLPPTPSSDSGQVEMADGSVIEVDAVLFATGYFHSYPFLKDYESRRGTSESSRIHESQYTVLNLHLDLFHIPNPTLVLLGVPANISAFSFFEYHSLAVARVFSGAAQLPSIRLMQLEYARRRASCSDRNLHVYGKVQEPRVVREISAWLNDEALRLGKETQLRHIEPYSEEYLRVKSKTVEGLRMRDEQDSGRLTAKRLVYERELQQVITA
ncbi:hypothetical protein P7C73_g802, partial [Tremellales sp. Uapishka_1]